MSLIVILAILMDYWLGEPQKYHPLVGFGQLANKVEAIFRNKSHSDLQKKMMGCMAIIALVSPFVFLIYFLNQSNYLSLLLSPVILYFCIAANSLKQHSLRVYQALEKADMAQAKKQVGMIVSRETERMTEDDVRKAAIESVLENGADAVFAPIFWFVVVGPVGVVLYRLSNTLDAMWGYKNQRFFYFGWAAARFDDLLNYIPARLTALSYALVGQTWNALKCWKNQAHLLDSPNGGPVMTSGAGSLNLKLGGSAWYHGKRKNKIFFGMEKLPSNNDINNANSLINKSLFLWVSLLVIVDSIGASFA
ncbi:MAG: cobalamin biosynthesis protein [Methylococcales bacterium]|nr:cobalamin biosynthesis protein [Methylococcales bacterium]